MFKKILLYLPIALMLISSVYAIPASWYGYVTLDGSTVVADGVIVDAYISSSIAASTTVGAVQSSGYYLIHVEGNSGDSVSFKIYGNNVTQAAQTWSAGFNHPTFNLTATSTANGGSCPTYSGYTSGTNVANLGCAGGYCVHDICRAASTHCGDGYCDSGESCSSDDSACSSGQACSNGCQSTGGGGSSVGGGGGTTTIIVCTEDWSCTEWSECAAPGLQTRTCTDANNCGTITNKPSEQQTCVYEEEIVEEIVEVEYIEPQPPSERGTEIGEIRYNDGVNWKWSGTTWVKEGTPAYGQIKKEKEPKKEKEKKAVVPLEMTVLILALIAAIIAILLYHRWKVKKLK